ncbi:hypothetical protein M407DRAFT_245916 [Tulasnella calospora MUT 4182]|uniref:Uncharacterized protein n=1 Tax=Tulasnella calospora MUT 4182 TaxID=1051891 RepID=A0A0C3KFD7_9AGAM|nr:hypothetical protein M407DRAFT_245916 [Tulasnella calospora MUT 4182]
MINRTLSTLYGVLRSTPSPLQRECLSTIAPSNPPIVTTLPNFSPYQFQRYSISIPLPRPVRVIKQCRAFVFLAAFIHLPAPRRNSLPPTISRLSIIRPRPCPSPPLPLVRFADYIQFSNLLV